METYIAPEHRKLLEQNQLGDFDQIWHYKAIWFEEPNNRRGGWSGVGRLVLRDANGREQSLFLKRQQNHRRRTFRHPLHGEPTFSCEFRMMRYLADHGVPVPVPVFFGQRDEGGDTQAALMTEELLHFTSLEAVTEELFRTKPAIIATRRAVLRGVATSVRKLHDAGIQHRSLYPRHLFLRLVPGQDPEVVVIDLEKSRRKFFPALRTLNDLATLDRQAKFWSRTDRLYFFMSYMGISRFTPWTKLLCRAIYKRSHRSKLYNPSNLKPELP